MPLSTPEARTDIHRRAVTCTGHERGDGLWDIEGHLTDTKSYAFNNKFRGTVEPGMPVHEMWLRLTIDDQFTIQAIEAVTDYGPFRPCQDATGNFEKLVGLTIEAGWMRKVRAQVGGAAGCTHLVELLGPMATTAFQTIWPLRQSREKPAAADGASRPGAKRKPPLLDSCFAMRSDGDVARDLWPDYFADGEKGGEGS